MSTVPRPHLVFALEYPIAYGGGVSVLVRELVRGLASEFRISLISPDSPADLEQAGLAGALERHLFWQIERASRKRARELSARIAEWEPSLVHFHCGGNYGWGNRRPGTSPIPLLARRGIACVTTLHLVVSILHGAIDLASPWWLKAAALPVAWLGRLSALRSSRAEIAVSDHDLAHLRRWYWPYRDRLHRIYHSRLADMPPPPRPMSMRSPVILHVGHRARRKGQHILVQAFASIARRHSAYRLLLVGPPGDDIFERELSACVELHGLQNRVEIIGPRADVSAFMQDAAVYVQPSLEEALGLALQEALFYGCASIGAAVGGIPEMIDHEENGLLVAPGDAAGLASALDRLLGDSSMLEKYSAAAATAIRDRGMSSREMIRRHRALYDAIIPAAEVDGPSGATSPAGKAGPL